MRISRTFKKRAYGIPRVKGRVMAARRKRIRSRMDKIAVKDPKTIGKNRAKFLNMVKTRYPKLYRTALVRAGNRNLSGLGGSWWDTISTSIQSVLPQALQFKQQKDLMDMQLKRAKAGLPPADVSSYTPVVRVQADVAPETRTAIIDQLGKPLLFGGMALAAYMLLSKKRR